MNKTYIDIPKPRTMNQIQSILRLTKGLVLSPIYCALSYFMRTPGLRFRAECVNIGLQLTKRMKDRRSLWSAYELIFSPMDSTRYFEFDFASQCLSTTSAHHYLDVASPRLFPLVFLIRHPKVIGTLINPDVKDLEITKTLGHDLGLASRCSFHSDLIENIAFLPTSFDLITCISVLEHIPDDVPALLKIWSLLKPRGHFILTVPCKSQQEEQYISYNEYGILSPGPNGYTFWQRYYDSSSLLTSIFNNIGKPIRSAIYGEKKNGTFAANAALKRSLGPYYPFWKEPYLMGRDYRLYESVDKLPGEGAIAMEFLKL